MDGILHDLSIVTKVCPYPSNATKMLDDGSTDLIVFDLEAEKSAEFSRQIGCLARQKPTVLAVSAVDGATPIAHLCSASL